MFRYLSLEEAAANFSTIGRIYLASKSIQVLDFNSKKAFAVCCKTRKQVSEMKTLRTFFKREHTSKARFNLKK